jgi:predicted transcriptional regulator
MKTATLPALRVQPEVRDAVESLLETGETLSSFVEQAVLERIERRRYQSEFIARGLIARDKARETNHYISADEVLSGLGQMLQAIKTKHSSGK